MVNVTKINKLFPTVVHEFQYIADDNLTKAIKNEDLETKIINHTSSSVDNNLQKRKEYKPLVDKILSTTKEICELHEYEYKAVLTADTIKKVLYARFEPALLFYLASQSSDLKLFRLCEVCVS